jgi:hypothetical protein
VVKTVVREKLATKSINEGLENVTPHCFDLCVIVRLPAQH